MKETVSGCFFSEHSVDTLCSGENTHMFVYIFGINVWIAGARGTITITAL